MRQKKRKLHELPNKKLKNLGRLDSPQMIYFSPVSKGFFCFIFLGADLNLNLFLIQFLII